MRCYRSRSLHCLQHVNTELLRQIASLQEQLAAGGGECKPRSARNVDAAHADHKDLRDNIDEMFVAEKERLVGCLSVCPVPATHRGVYRPGEGEISFQMCDHQWLCRALSQKRVNHDEADTAENGPKEISIFCQKARGDDQGGSVWLGLCSRQRFYGGR